MNGSVLADWTARRVGIRLLIATVLVTHVTSCGLLRYHGSKPDATPLDVAPPVVDLTRYKSPNERGAQQHEELSIAIAFSGGGSRSANLATGVLLGMEQIPVAGASNLLNEIDYFSTVSGGGLAAGLYLETVKRYVDNSGDLKLRSFSYATAFESVRPNCPGGKDTLRRQLERGYHDDILDGFWNPIVWFSNFDRGDSIERELDDRILGRECKNQDASLTLGDFFVAAGAEGIAPTLPMWVTNATVFQNGWRFGFAPNVIEQHEIDGFTHRFKRLKSQDPKEIAYDMPAAVGLKASASFPAAIPSSTVPSQKCILEKGPQDGCYLQLLDGGLSDNTGVITALQLLDGEDKSRPTRKLLIVVDAFPGDLTPHSRKEGSPTILKVLARVTEINKDAFRHLLRHHYEMFGKDTNVRVLYLTIDDMEFLRRIGTNFNVTKDQQTALIECGKKLILDKRQSVDAWIEGRDTGVGLLAKDDGSKCEKILTEPAAAAR